MCAPDFLASLSAMATACLRLVTFRPLPDARAPSLYSFITLCTLLFPLEPDRFPFVGIALLLRGRLSSDEAQEESQPQRNQASSTDQIKRAGGLRQGIARCIICSGFLRRIGRRRGRIRSLRLIHLLTLSGRGNILRNYRGGRRVRRRLRGSCDKWRRGLLALL